MEDKKIETWPDLAIGLYDKLTGRNAEITYDFENFNVGVPRAVGSSDKTEWTLNGTLRIRTSDNTNQN